MSATCLLEERHGQHRNASFTISSNALAFIGLIAITASLFQRFPQPIDFSRLVGAFTCRGYRSPDWVQHLRFHVSFNWHRSCLFPLAAKRAILPCNDFRAVGLER